MLVSSTIKLSLNNLLAQKMQSFLTMLGIIIGISSIIIISSVVAGAQSLIINQMNSIGSNLIGVLAGGTEEEGPPAAVFGITITTLKDADTEAVAKLPHVIAASSYASAVETVNWENQNITASIYGVSPEYPLLADSRPELGIFFSEENKKDLADVAVVGSQVRKDLFGDAAPLGEKIQIKNRKFTIIGAMEPLGSAGFQNVDNMIFLPVTTAQKKILGISHIGFLRAKIDAAENVDATIEAVKTLLRERHNIGDPKEDDFTVRSLAEAIKTLGKVTAALQFFLVAIISISLLVGGIGIMNIMLAAVTERVKEIGLRRAVGATRREIRKQFLLETIIISSLGAIIGIVIGAIVSLVIAQIVNRLGYDWTFRITVMSIFLSTIFAVGIGLTFGLYPAKKAGRLNPIESLRYE